MCGRYYIDETVASDIERLVMELDRQMKHRQAGDIYPTQTAPVICSKGKMLYGADMKWGFETKDHKQLINARAETALEKPSFSDSVMHRRCIIPATKFYEWNREKQKVTFSYPASPSIYMAGFYRMDGDGPHFVILTTAANDSMSPVHDRMPLILEEQNIKRWFFEDDKVKEILAKPSPMLERQQDYEQLSLF